MNGRRTSEQKPHAGIKEIADTPKRLDILQELAEPGLKLLAGHAVPQACGFPMAASLPQLADQVI